MVCWAWLLVCWTWLTINWCRWPSVGRSRCWSTIDPIWSNNMHMFRQKMLIFGHIVVVHWQAKNHFHAERVTMEVWRLVRPNRIWSMVCWLWRDIFGLRWCNIGWLWWSVLWSWMIKGLRSNNIIWLWSHYVSWLWRAISRHRSLICWFRWAICWCWGLVGRLWCVSRFW